MSNSIQSQISRQEAIRDLLLSRSASTQQSLVDALNLKGFKATQSSVSRDLKEIGAIKTNDGYSLIETLNKKPELEKNILTLIVSINEVGSNLLVIKTPVGTAQQVALFLDNCDWPEIVGNIGGDDTVFTAVPNKSCQRNLVNKINFITNSH
tara:strand:+ start:458 stop:913 length:456 start_codon:yes stop_codon:yes gene_type:complete